MNENRIGFTMRAVAGTTAPAPLPDRLPLGWVRIPVRLQVVLPAGMIEPAARPARADAAAMTGRQPG